MPDRHPGATAVARVTVRCTERLLHRLDALARERGRTRAALVREMLEAGVQGVAAPPSESPTEEELLELLSEKARQGNAAAIRSLLARTDDTDPRQRALAAFEAIAAERRQ